MSRARRAPCSASAGAPFGRKDALHRAARGWLLAGALTLLVASCKGDASNGGDGGNGAAGGAPLTQGVGLPCEEDDDCPSSAGLSLSCISPRSDAEFGSGSPQGGYCSAPCTGADDCRRLDALSTCVPVGGNLGSFCLATCQTGTGAALLKCGSDRAQVCASASEDADVGLCFPRCQSDASCGEGLVCDPGASGLCRQQPRPGGGVGAPCSPETAEADCASGICLDFRDGAGNLAGRACSASCTFASSNGCGHDPDTSDPRESACLQPQFEEGGPGDLGLCFELCDFDSDCEQEGWVCRSLAGAEEVLGRVGECVPESLVGGAPREPDAGVDG